MAGSIHATTALIFAGVLASLYTFTAALMLTMQLIRHSGGMAQTVELTMGELDSLQVTTRSAERRLTRRKAAVLLIRGAQSCWRGLVARAGDMYRTKWAVI